MPANFGGFTSACTSVEERLVRFERNLERLVLRSLDVGAYADDSLPIARSVAENNFGPILAAFPIQAFGKDSATYVIDVTDFFGGDTRLERLERGAAPPVSGPTLRSGAKLYQHREVVSAERRGPPHANVRRRGATFRPKRQYYLTRCGSPSCSCRRSRCGRASPTNGSGSSPSSA